MGQQETYTEQLVASRLLLAEAYSDHGIPSIRGITEFGL